MPRGRWKWQSTCSMLQCYSQRLLRMTDKYILHHRQKFFRHVPIPSGQTLQRSSSVRLCKHVTDSLTCTAAGFVLQMNIDCVVVVVVHVATGAFVELLSSQGHFGNHLKGRLHVDGVFGAGFENRIAQASQSVVCDVHQLLRQGRDFLAFVHVDLVSYYDEREVSWVQHVGSDKKLVLPRSQVVQGFLVGHVIAQHTAVGASVERHTQTSEPLLARRVPYLQGHSFVIDGQVFGQKIGANGGFVSVGKLIVDKSSHERGFAHARVAQNDHFQQCFLTSRHVGMCIF
ncbi:conserved hypothetical protein [Clavispora lusitaniae ATCC 42720]|uniref:Uncharacterized protein n=1 Tax=Clavispora lusitaniae (strain ATCC 42720) TaxID=306902 RepID=C4XX05_CLAL4|nr:uncharacterized protein CLUG_00478 [Clavispora lusitaniae ATCC 42720]EEQ36355.1 conserved hypothetical protein [Clavispora lusitaniae ATCC 42720]